jgi:endonuclease/exonuclease/phosphatase family metal-dependent hydrolase
MDVEIDNGRVTNSNMFSHVTSLSQFDNTKKDNMILLLLFLVGSTSTRVGTINILAPSWADPTYYPSVCHDKLVQPQRTNRTLEWVKTNWDGVDAIAFQETEASTVLEIKKTLVRYDVFAVYHDDTYWASSITSDFHPNGVAIAVRRDLYNGCHFEDVPLTTGNHAAIATCNNIATGCMTRFVSVHLDSDRGGRRATEAATLSKLLTPVCANFILGDFNADTTSGVLRMRFSDHTDILRAVGVEERTHPFTSGYNNAVDNIDHLLVRGGRAMEGKVWSNGLESLYPNVPGQVGKQNEVSRICGNFVLTGTDHYPVSGMSL